jgi:flagella basal body P-ring formation protein FlgA
MMKKIFSLLLSCQRRLASRIKYSWIPACAGMTVFFALPVMADDTAITPSYIFNITYDDAQDAVSKALTEKLAAETKTGQSVAAVISPRKTIPLYSSNKPVDVEMRGLRVDSSINRWSANLIISSDNKVISALPLSGRYMIMSEVPVLKHQVRSGDVISNDDVELKAFPQESTHKDTVSDISDMIGKSPVRVISPNRPVRTSELSAPALIKKNALVQMRYKTQSMEITTTGQALSDGAKGDVIEVRNPVSKKITRAVVASGNIVDVLATSMETSEAQPPAQVNY